MFQIEFDSADKVVGIDLGTTNSLIAWMISQQARHHSGEDGDKLVPSIVSLSTTGES